MTTNTHGNATVLEEVDGVRVFADHSAAESPETRAALDRLIADARQHGCEEALLRNDHNIQYLTDETRARYIGFLGIGPGERVLEIGASMGQHSRLIAGQCAHLDTLEVVPEQARFAQLWCAESGLGNVQVNAGGASGYLPFGSDSYDLVVMNYVLEWCAGRAGIPPADFHLRLLSEIWRVLRPGGRLFVSTKNRYGLRLLLGGVDEHLGIRFGHALPLGLGPLLARRGKAGAAGADGARGHLHSRAGIEALLRRAGFATLQPVLCFPDARYPRLMVPFDAGASRALRDLGTEGLSRRDRLYTRLPGALKRRTAISHVYIAEKAATA